MSTALILLSLLSAPAEGVQLAQLSIEQRVIIRIPMSRRKGSAVPPAPQSQWQQHKGPRCIAMRSVRAASVAEGGAIDLVTMDMQRFRAQMGRPCRTTDFYSGFYMEPTSDGRLCARRDLLQTRGGVECQIDRFYRLVRE